MNSPSPRYRQVPVYLVFDCVKKLLYCRFFNTYGFEWIILPVFELTNPVAVVRWCSVQEKIYSQAILNAHEFSVLFNYSFCLFFHTLSPFSIRTSKTVICEKNPTNNQAQRASRLQRRDNHITVCLNQSPGFAICEEVAVASYLAADVARAYPLEVLDRPVGLCEIIPHSQCCDTSRGSEPAIHTPWQYRFDPP